MRFRAVILMLSTTLVCATSLVAQRPSCGPATIPKDLPAVRDIIDSSGALLELQQAKVLRDSMQFTLLVLAGDSIPVVNPLDSTDALAAAVLARTAWPQKSADLWAVRVHVTGGSTPALTISRATYCPPELTPASGPPVRMTPELGEQRVIDVPAGSPRYAHFPRVNGTAPVPPIVEVEITPLGAVHAIKVLRSSGSLVFDKYVKDHLALQTYEPALLDGIPVPAVIRAVKSVAEQPLPPGP